jgi:hypothetical protein
MTAESLIRSAVTVHPVLHGFGSHKPQDVVHAAKDRMSGSGPGCLLMRDSAIIYRHAREIIRNNADNVIIIGSYVK